MPTGMPPILRLAGKNIANPKGSLFLPEVLPDATIPRLFRTRRSTNLLLPDDGQKRRRPQPSASRTFAAPMLCAALFRSPRTVSVISGSLPSKKGETAPPYISPQEIIGSCPRLSDPGNVGKPPGCETLGAIDTRGGFRQPSAKVWFTRQRGFRVCHPIRKTLD